MDSSGENEQGLKKILDFTRLGSLVILLLHFYFYCYGAFREWRLTAEITDRFLHNLTQTGLFNSVYHSKLLAFAMLVISLLGTKGKKSEKIYKHSILVFLTSGSVLFFLSHYLLRIDQPIDRLATL